jgi:hypothetical protein
MIASTAYNSFMASDLFELVLRVALLGTVPFTFAWSNHAAFSAHTPTLAVAFPLRPDVLKAMVSSGLLGKKTLVALNSPPFKKISMMLRSMIPDIRHEPSSGLNRPVAENLSLKKGLENPSVSPRSSHTSPEDMNVPAETDSPDTVKCSGEGCCCKTSNVGFEVQCFGLDVGVVE